MREPDVSATAGFQHDSRLLFCRTPSPSSRRPAHFLRSAVFLVIRPLGPALSLAWGWPKGCADKNKSAHHPHCRRPLFHHSAALLCCFAAEKNTNHAPLPPSLITPLRQQRSAEAVVIDAISSLARLARRQNDMTARGITWAACLSPGDGSMRTRRTKC